MKIGFILKITDNGEREAFSFNKEKDSVWSRYATDVRPYIKELKNFDGTRKVVILLRFFGINGYMIAIIKARPEGSGRADDNTAAWIHIPSKIDISTYKLHEIIKTVESAITCKGGIDKEKLKNLFSEEYREKDVLFAAPDSVVSNEHGSLAYRGYGIGTGYTLEELLTDSEIVQTEYSNYKGVFLLDSTSEIYTDCIKLKETKSNYIRLEPPVTKFGYRPFIMASKTKKILFSKPIEIPCSGVLHIIWCKEGYKDIPQEISVSSNKKIEFVPKPEEIRRCIRREWFRVYDEENHISLISKAEIKVDGQSFDNKGILYAVENSDNSHEVEVYCDGYETYNERISIKENIPIYLKAKENIQEFVLPRQEGNGLDEDATIIIKTKKNSKSMPLKGYSKDGEHLRYNTKNIRKLKLKYFLIGFISLSVILGLYQGYIAIDDYFDNHKFQLGWPPIIEKNNETTDIQQKGKTDELTEKTDEKKAAIAYLDRNNKWHKDSLERYEITRGLFDAMNTFELQSLTGQKYSDLGQCRQFKDIIDAAKNCSEKGVVLHEYYNTSSSDKIIVISNYVNRLQTALSEKQGKEQAQPDGKTKSSTRSTGQAAEPESQDEPNFSDVMPT